MADYNDKAHVTMEPMTREMQIPKGTKMIGIVGDNESERVDIDIPRWYDGTDLGSKSIYIVVSNDDEHSDMIIPEIKRDEEQLHLTWVVKSKHVSSEGTVYAHILATDTSGFRWQSLDGEYEVKTVNDGPESMPDTQVTAVEQKLVEMDSAKLQAANAAAAAIAAATETAPPIISAAEGVASVATDSADRPMRGLTVYGKTTQDGTPSEDAPVDLIGAGTASTLRIVTAGRNLAALTPRTENHLGITSSYDAQTGVVTVTGTATAMAFVSYWLREPIPAGIPLVIGLGNGSSDANITIRAQSASENANTNIGVLNDTNRVVNKVFTHAFEFIAIRVEAGATVNMKLQIGVTVGSDSSGYTWTHPDDPTSAQIVIPGLHFAVGGLLHGLPVVSGGNYTDENGQQWIADTVEYDAETGTAQLVQRVWSVMFDGDAEERWTLETQKNPYLSIAVQGKAPGGGLCTHYTQASIYPSTGQTGFSSNASGGKIVFRPPDYATITVDAWRARLADSPVTVLYALAEPVTTPITGDELAALTALRSRYPATTIYNDAGTQMEARYVADTKNYIDQRIEQLTNAVVSTGANI